jgi:hypothetical protein
MQQHVCFMSNCGTRVKCSCCRFLCLWILLDVCFYWTKMKFYGGHHTFLFTF